MRKKSILLIGLLSVLALALSACGTPKAPSWYGLSAAGETAYLAAGSFVYAVDVNTGDDVWKYPFDKANNARQYFAAPVLTADGQLLIGSEGAEHVLTSLNPEKLAALAAKVKEDPEYKATDNELSALVNWEFTEATDKWIASPLATAGAIYAPSADHRLYMLDLNGNLQRAFEGNSALWGQPITDGTLVYVTSLDHTVYALDPQSALVDGEWSAKWSVDLGAAIPGPAVLGPDGLLYVGTFNSEVAVIDPRAETPAVVRTFPAEGWVWSAPAFDDGGLYFGDLNGNLYGFDRAGNSIWPALQPDAAILSTPLIFNGQVILTTESGGLFAVKDGQIVWEKTVGGKLYGPAVAAGKFLLVASMENSFMLAAYDGNGLQAWTFPQE